MCWRRAEELRRVSLQSQHGITRPPQVGSNQFNLVAMIKWSDFPNFQGLEGTGGCFGLEEGSEDLFHVVAWGLSRIMKGE